VFNVQPSVLSAEEYIVSMRERKLKTLRK